jgi:hypothetical protein
MIIGLVVFVIISLKAGVITLGHYLIEKMTNVAMNAIWKLSRLDSN